ncbi:MAG: hypothetical protein IPK35_07155 [Saprospiraceae bacterium]|nr:hypothetical protein [Saprospiraceae bacterium]
MIYKIDFLLKDSDVKALSEVPVDTIGIMWTSGFESYVIYNIDVIMKQLSCIKTSDKLRYVLTEYLMLIRRSCLD